MSVTVRGLFELPKFRAYRRPSPVVLVNGLAGQSESWFANRARWSRDFDLKVPELLVYDGPLLRRRIEEGLDVSVGYLTDRLATYLDEFVQRPPYHFVASSLGGQVVLTYATRHPENVGRIVLMCPSGLHGSENLPMIEGVTRGRYDKLVRSVFHRNPLAASGLIDSLTHDFRSRDWKRGVLKTLRGTLNHSVAPLLDRITNPTLIIWGERDRVLSDVPGSIREASRIAQVRQLVIPNCGHAPQIEVPRLVNALVSRYLRDKLGAIPQSLDADRFLGRVR